MSKPFDYSKWDNIELSDDEDDVHPNIDKESWFRMKHRSRVEREEHEEKDKSELKAAMEKANQRIKVLEHDLKKLQTQTNNDSDDSDDDDLLDDRETLQTELQQLRAANVERQAKLEAYEKQKKWNVDNMCQVKEERTIVNPTAGKVSYTETGYAVEPTPTAEAEAPKTKGSASKSSSTTSKPKASPSKAATTGTSTNADAPTEPATITTTTTTTSSNEPTQKQPPQEQGQTVTTYHAPTEPSTTGPTRADFGAMETYHEFTEKYSELVEDFMKCQSLSDSEQFLLAHGNVLLQENASNYLLLASLEDEMNGHHDKMKQTARQSQLITNIAELAKTVHQHPGNVIRPFFARLKERPHLEEFLAGHKAFCDSIVKRAIVKKAEIDEERRADEVSHDLNDIPRDQRLGPGGLDPLEVIETLPKSMVDAFESRDVEELQKALMEMDPADAERYMKDCIDSGLWVANAGES